MTNNWDIELAKKFKNRDNKQQIGNVVGKVISVLPDLKVSILEGQIVLNKEQLYISVLLENIYKREYEISNIVGKTDAVNDGGDNASSHFHSIETLKGTITFIDTLKVNDEVLLIPTADEQTWFIVDKVRKLGD